MKDTLDKTNAMIMHLKAVNEILTKYEYKKEKLIPILQEVQKEYKYLSKDIISYVSTSLKIPPAKVYGVATFYSHFSLKPKGKYVFKLCDGTACHVKESIGILNALHKKLNLNENKTTTDDMLFTVETVSCLGACGLAPVLVMNEDVFGQVTPEKAIEIVDSIQKSEELKTENKDE